jgi:hypothetical protein
MRDLTGTKGGSDAYLGTTMEALAVFGAPLRSTGPTTATQKFANKGLDMEPTAFCYVLAHNFAPITYFRLDPAVNDLAKCSIRQIAPVGGLPEHVRFSGLQ